MTAKQATDLIIIEDVSNTELAHYGNRDIMRELAGRLMSFHPAAKEVGNEGMLAAAQLAVLMGASPLPALNEIHIWRDKKGRIQVATGINYWRRQAEARGGIRWVIAPRPMEDSERETYGIAPNELAAIAKGMRARDYRDARYEGMNFNQADAACSLIGIGVAGKDEYAKSGRPPVWTAIKRAETDFLKKAFPFQAGAAIPGPGLRWQGEHFEADESGYWDQIGADYEREYPESDESIDEINDILFDGGGSTSQVIDEEAVAETPQDLPPALADTMSEFSGQKKVSLLDVRDRIEALGLAENKWEAWGRLQKHPHIQAMEPVHNEREITGKLAAQVVEWVYGNEAQAGDEEE